MEQKMMKANLSDSHEIKMIDGLCTHAELTRISINPNDPAHPSIMKTVKCWPVDVFQAMEDLNDTKKHHNPVDWKKAGNWAEAKVIHDPTLLSDKERKAITDYRDSILKPKVVTAGTIEAMQAEIDRLKRKAGVHN